MAADSTPFTPRLQPLPRALTWGLLLLAYTAIAVLLIAAGGHGKLGTKQSDFVVAFTLPCGLRRQSRFKEKFLRVRIAMDWGTPEHEEISLACEISSHANAELGLRTASHGDE